MNQLPETSASDAPIDRAVAAVGAPSIQPPPLPRPFGFARVFRPWLIGRKISHGRMTQEPIYSLDQLAQRDLEWQAILASACQNQALSASTASVSP